MSHIGEVYIFILHEFVRNVENMNEMNNIIKNRLLPYFEYVDGKLTLSTGGIKTKSIVRSVKDSKNLNMKKDKMYYDI